MEKPIKARGTRKEVWEGTAMHTGSGLSKDDLFLSKTGKIVSRRQSEAAKARRQSALKVRQPDAADREKVASGRRVKKQPYRGPPGGWGGPASFLQVSVCCLYVVHRSQKKKVRQNPPVPIGENCWGPNIHTLSARDRFGCPRKKSARTPSTTTTFSLSLLQSSSPLQNPSLVI